jgi:hypothetical protein
MSISSLNANLVSHNFNQVGISSTSANLQSLGTALSGGDLVGAKNIFTAISQSQANTNSDPTNQTLMGQLGDAINGGHLPQAQQIASALQAMQSQNSTNDPLLGGGGLTSTSSGLNDSLFSALSLTGVGSGSSMSLAGISSLSSSSLISPAQEIAQNMDNFLNHLLTTLQSKNPSSATGSASSASGKQNPYVPSTSNQMSSGLQGLIQQLAKNPNAATELNLNPTSSSTNSTGVISTSNDPQVTELQNSYDKLVNSQGGSGGASSLISFLQNFETNMKNMQSNGGFLNLQA